MITCDIRKLIILGRAVENNHNQHECVALDLNSMKLLYVRIEDTDILTDLDAVSICNPIAIDAVVESSHRDMWIAYQVHQRHNQGLEKIRELLSIKASYPFQFLDGRFHLRYGLGKLKHFKGLRWDNERLWMTDCILAGTDKSKTIMLYGDKWNVMKDNNTKQDEFEKTMKDWSRNVFVVLARLDIKRESYCCNNILIM